MTEPEKKLTFGFSKVVKKSNLVRPPAPKEKPNNVQFIACLEENSIKLRDGEVPEKGPLIIPIIGPPQSSTIINGKSIADIAEDFSTIDKTQPQTQQDVLQSVGPLNSLDALAAREILQGAANSNKEEVATLESLPAVENIDKEILQRESTLEDYENIPVSQFGLAMLRGMGWKPDEGIGKNKQVVAVTAPSVRPKGMGLGADKASIGSAPTGASGSERSIDEDLKVVKGAYVKVLGGSYRQQYAQVEGFSDDSGRVILKMAIGGHTVSVVEASVHPVTKSEYGKNSKVLNVEKYEKFKKLDDEGKTSEIKVENPSDKLPTVGKPAQERRSPSPFRTRIHKKGKSNAMNYGEQISSHKRKKQSPTRPTDGKSYASDSDSSSESSGRNKKYVRGRSKSPSPKRKQVQSPPRRSKMSPSSKHRGERNDRYAHKSERKRSKSKRGSSADASHSRHHRKRRESTSDSRDSSPSSSVKRKKKVKRHRRSNSRSPCGRRRQ